jgi:uncharacterized phage protein gp47/JayE
MGMTTAGFIPEGYEAISTRIRDRIEAINPGFDFSIESPDGQMIDIMSQELADVWNQMDLVYLSYHPNYATGEALRNLGLITGTPFKKNTRSSARIDLIGTAGSIVPQYTEFSDAIGNSFFSVLESVVPSSVDVLAENLGLVEVTVGTIVNIVSTVDGLDSIDQPADGSSGELEKSEAWYRNIRQRTVFRQSAGQSDGMLARLLELGVNQAFVVNNDTAVPLVDGTPALSIQAKVGEFEGVSDLDIATVILNTKPLGCPTYGTTTVSVEDSQGNPHDINFTKATEIFIFINLEVTFLQEDIGGATDRIKYELATFISSLLAGEDVIWSRLFEYITPYAKAQVDLLEIGTSDQNWFEENVSITDVQYASCLEADINILVA